MKSNQIDPDSGQVIDPHTNRDPLTGEPGAHPLGTAAGAAGAGLAGAALGAIAGPIGSAAGAVIGAVVGGLTGKGFAEGVNPTDEAQYWRENHSGQSFAAGYPYDEFADAYRVGYEGHIKYGATHQSFGEAEPFLRDDYATFKSPLEWERARPAVNAAWMRLIDEATRAGR